MSLQPSFSRWSSPALLFMIPIYSLLFYILFCWPSRFRHLRTFNYCICLIWFELPLSLPALAAFYKDTTPLQKCHFMTWHQKKWQFQWGLPLKKKPLSRSLSPATDSALLQQGFLLDRRPFEKSRCFKIILTKLEYADELMIGGPCRFLFCSSVTKQ